MTDISHRKWLGVLVGFFVGYTVLAIMSRFYGMAIILMIWPLIVPIIGSVLGFWIYKKMGARAPKAISTIFICCSLVGITLIYAEMRERFIEYKHERVALNVIPSLPNSVMVRKSYSRSDGFTNGDTLAMHFAAQDIGIEELLSFFNKKLIENGWEENGSYDNSYWYRYAQKWHFYQLTFHIDKIENNSVEYSILFSISSF